MSVVGEATVYSLLAGLNFNSGTRVLLCKNVRKLRPARLVISLVVTELFYLVE